ncbi:transposase [Cohnella sp. AR92]|uniref:transposase n=1 Tax=Cohnella sp. AR92 TaxID=648716 RepID=UPI000F8F5835|nr:transposase [Cohnella sp. AR92]RUS48656.1 DDE transposase [Cohnella sp. AR92]
MLDDAAAFEEFKKRFSSEQACAEALFLARWPTGFRCPQCGHSRCYEIRTRRLPLYECSSCRRQTSIIAGTILEGSSTSLSRWFQAIYLLSQPAGISSVDLCHLIGVTYKTAWLMSHKIRHAMSAEIESLVLAGTLRIEHFEYGSVYYPDACHPLLLAGAINEQNEAEQIRIVQPSPEHIDDASRRILKEGWRACQQACTIGENVTYIQKAARSLPSMHAHKIRSRRWLNRTFCGIRAKHLQAYLNEYCFRANRISRGVCDIDSLFCRVFAQCAAVQTIPYPVLTRDKPVLQPPWRKLSSKAKWRGRWLTLRSA